MAQQPQKDSFFQRYRERFNRPGPGVEKDAPKKTGLALFFDILSREWFELIKLNMLFLIFCIPVLTIPTACTAMCKVTMMMVRDENCYVYSDFWECFRAEFLRSTIAGGIFLLFTGGLAYTWIFYFFQPEQHVLYIVFTGASAMALLIMLFAGFYLFPMLASVKLTIAQYLRNSLLLAFIGLKNNVITAVAVGAILLPIPVLIPFSMLFVLFFMFALVNLITTFCAYHGIKRFVVKDDEF